MSDSSQRTPDGDEGQTEPPNNGVEKRADISRRAFVGAAIAAPFVGSLAHTAPKLQRAREHIVVVGAGAFGGWTALALLRAGKRVTLIDAWGAGHARASSGGETRVIRASYGGVEAYTEMAARALTLWRVAERQWQRPVLHTTGALWLCGQHDDYVRRSIEPMRAAGLSIDELSHDEAAARFPQFNIADARTIFFERDAGFIAARAACELVRDTFVREGGDYRQSWVRPLGADGAGLARIVLADHTQLSADQYVFACGPWLGQVFPEVVGRRIVPTRQEVFFFGTPAGDTRYDTGELPVWVHVGDRFTYGVPQFERRGIKIADDSPGEIVDPTTMSRVPSEAGLMMARSILAQRFPGLADAPLLEARVCQYEASTDGHFLIDRHPGMENLWLVGGGSGHGFKMGPALGEYVAGLMAGTVAANPRFGLARLQPRP